MYMYMYINFLPNLQRTYLSSKAKTYYLGYILTWCLIPEFIVWIFFRLQSPFLKSLHDFRNGILKHSYF